MQKCAPKIPKKYLKNYLKIFNIFPRNTPKIPGENLTNKGW